MPSILNSVCAGSKTTCGITTFIPLASIVALSSVGVGKYKLGQNNVIDPLASILVTGSMVNVYVAAAPDILVLVASYDVIVADCAPIGNRVRIRVCCSP
jgi:hypothetical protein